MIHVNFVMEQHVGLLTYYRNLQKYIDADSRIAPHWIDVTYRSSANLWWTKLPFLSEHIRGSFLGRQQTRRGLRENSAEVNFFFTQVPALLAGSLRYRSPYVLCTDVTPIQYDKMAVHYDHQPDKPGLLGTYKHRQNKKVFHRAARILTWSNWARQSFIEDYDVCESSVEVVPVGVDLNLWHPISDSESQDSTIRILFVGGEFQRKGGDLLLQAFQNLPSGAAKLSLVTRTKIAPQEGVTVYENMQPNSPELIALFQSCDVLVLPTQADTFGIVAVEASAAGLPVLMTDVGGVRDIVVDGETGFLLPPDDVDVLTERLRYLVAHADVRRRMGMAARAQAVAKFDASKNGKKVADILLEVAAAI